MYVKRAKLSWLERLYFPALIEGLRITWRHFARTFFKKALTMEYPEERWVVPAGYRGAPYLVKDTDNNTKCVSCQLCEFVCPPKAIKIIPPGNDGPAADRANAEKMPEEFEINMLRCIFCGFCQEVCPEEAIFLQEDYSLVGLTRGEMIYDKEKLLELGGVHQGPIRKWEKKLKDAEAQEAFPIKN